MVVKCSLCGAAGATKATCPLNPKAVNKKPIKHTRNASLRAGESPKRNPLKKHGFKPPPAYISDEDKIVKGLTSEHIHVLLNTNHFKFLKDIFGMDLVYLTASMNNNDLANFFRFLTANLGEVGVVKITNEELIEDVGKWIDSHKL